MSSISMNAPTIQINPSGLQNLMSFIFSHERILKEFGAIKIQLSSDCTLALKKRKISPTCTTAQQITRVTDNEYIYSIQKREDIKAYDEQRPPITNEQIFWSSLSDSNNKFNRSSVCVLPNKTLFCQEWHRKDFSIHCIPRQSLLKLGGSKVTDQFISCLTRAHGPGAIFPLANAQQRLFSLVYHHQGGPRYWYIIPSYARGALTKIFQRQGSSSCLEHGELLVDPLILGKHHIRYHRLIQYPNEFVVLSAGALSQSFTEDASWNESIPFALPSWIEEGHATARNSPCQCNINIFALPKTIDICLFRPELIQKYIRTFLNIVNDGKTSITQVQAIPSINMKPIIRLHPIVPKYDELLPSLIISSVSNPVLNEHENEQNQKSPQQFDQHRTNQFYNTTIQNTSLTASTEPGSKDCFPDLSEIQGNHYYQTDTFMKTPLNLDNNETIANQFSTFEDFMDIMAHTPASTSSTYTQTGEPISAIRRHQKKQLMYESPISMHTTISNNYTRNNFKKGKINQTVNRYKTLLVSGLRNDVNETDLYRHFIGCTNVTLKKCKTSSLKYAFILHSTATGAKHNFGRPINYSVLGQECHVKYAGDSPSLPVGHRSCDERTIVVKSIPENVSEEDLRNLFTNCHISRYCPARIVHHMTTSVAATSKTKTFWGYAFLVYNTVQEAANVIEHPIQYQINGRTLTVAFYRNKNQL